MIPNKWEKEKNMNKVIDIELKHNDGRFEYPFFVLIAKGC